MSAIWQDCQGDKRIKPLAGEIFRMVESQIESATLNYVDTLDEQVVLEELLENTKPAYPDNFAGLDYLLKTPFRYPPLRYGSRFGRRHENSLFYAGCDQDSTLAEAAFYRFVFWESMQGDTADLPPLTADYTLFSVEFVTKHGINLSQPPFDLHNDALMHQTSYMETQLLGSAMREAGVEAFKYASARDPQHGLCAALFIPAPFKTKKPKDRNQWKCQVTAHQVTWKKEHSAEIYRFDKKLFLVEGTFPLPAA